MSFRKFARKFIACLLALIICIFNTGVGAAEKTARLRNCLETVHMYQVFPVDYLANMAARSKSRFKEMYDDRYVVFNGLVKFSSVADNHKSVKVYGSENYIEVDTSEQSVKNIVGTLKVGDSVTVYGKVDGAEVEAEYLVINQEVELPSLQYIFYPDLVIEAETISDIAPDGHVSFDFPVEWKDTLVMGDLKNNGIKGYQFFLNALAPQNLTYAENFYIFYFTYETYLHPVKKNPDKYDVMDIEEIVVKNIIEELSGDFDADIQSIKLQDGTKLDYCSLVYKPADGNHYRLEFVFKPDSTGFVCMLYLYYPNDSAVNHLNEVAYLIQSIRN